MTLTRLHVGLFSCQVVCLCPMQGCGQQAAPIDSMQQGLLGDMSATTPVDTLPEIQDRDIHRLLTESLYKQIPTALLASGGVAVMTLLVIWEDVPLTHLTAWAMSLLLVSLLRYVWYRAFKRASGGEAANSFGWYPRYFVGILLAGVVWGSFVWALPRDMPIEHWIFIIFILGGMMAGGSSTSGAILESYLAFVLPICGSTIVWFYVEDVPFPASMSILTLLYTIILVVSVSHAGKTLRETFRLRFANVGLIDKLTLEQENSAQLVEELRHEVVRRSSREDQLNDYNRLLEMLAHGEALPVVLANLNGVVEKQLQGGMSSILVLDEEGRHISMVSAPSLTAEFNEAQQNQSTSTEAGSYAAAYRNNTVVIEDMLSDPRWTDYRDLAKQYGLQSCWSNPVRNAFGQVLGTLTVYHHTAYAPSRSDLDITMAAANIAGIAIEAKQAEHRLQNMAHHDLLTQLPNRAFLYDRLLFIIAQSKRREMQFALLFIDLDNFKEINDSLGHEAGDRMLRSIAQGLKLAVRDSDIVSRFGGDEFVILLMNIQDVADVNAVAKKIIASIKQPYPVGQKVWHIGGSIGISLFPADGQDADSLIQRADQAMYRAKEKGNHYTYYSEL
jgi:diguanylate cyclase (GGDEF)-like protein